MVVGIIIIVAVGWEMIGGIDGKVGWVPSEYLHSKYININIIIRIIN